MPIAITYGRVSTEERAKKGFSLPEQMTECRRRAQELGATEIIEFSDDVSGEILQRPGLSTAREIIRRGGVKWFVCLCADRFARNLAHQLLVADEIRQAGVDLVFTQQGYDDTAEGRFFFSIAGAVAELEKAKIKDRTARGRRGKLKTGRLPSYLDIYGYRFNTETDLLDLDETEAEWVRRMFSWAADEGLGPYVIRDRLNDLGVPAPRGAKWHGATIASILCNATYTGRLAVGTRDWTGYSLNKHRPPHERVRETWRPQDEWLYIDVPAVVAPELFAKVQDIISRRKGLRRSPRLLSGVVVCGLCGGRINYHRNRKGKRGRGAPYSTLVCNHRYPSMVREHVTMPQLCTLKSMPAWRLENHVWEQVVAWIWDPDALELARRKRQLANQSPEPMRNELAEVEAALSEAEAEHSRLVELVVKGLARSDREAPRMQALMDTIDRLEARRGELQSRLIVAPPPSQHLIDTARIREILAERLSDVTDEEKTHAIHALVRSVVVRGADPSEWEVIPV